MISTSRIRRRLILRRLVGGGAVFCTFLPGLDRSSSRAAAGVPLVILDPGHGGRDPGATGVGGTLEKDVTLASAIALKTVLEARGRYSVELTRTADHYLNRGNRVTIARDLRASLFLSLHADKMPDPAVRGASVYTLAKTASDAETEALAGRGKRDRCRRGRQRRGAGNFGEPRRA